MAQRVVTPLFGVRGRGQKMGLFSCNFAEPFFEVFVTLEFFLGAPRRLYACVVVVRNLDFLLFFSLIKLKMERLIRKKSIL